MLVLRTSLSTAVISVAALGVSGCTFLMPQPQQQPDPSDPSYQASAASGEHSQLEGPEADPAGGGLNSPPGSMPGGSTGVAPGAPTRTIPTTVEIRSECSKTVPVFYGEKPKFGSGTRSTVSSNSTSSQGRKADGTLTVWIIDESENGIASARVTPETRRVVIDRSCTGIRAE